MKTARAQESANCQAQEMERSAINTPKEEHFDTNTFRVSLQPGRYSSKIQHPSPKPNSAQPFQQRRPFPNTNRAGQPRDSYRPQFESTQTTASPCSFCGLQYHRRDVCPASGRVCTKCGKTGHFARCCRSTEVKPVRHISAEGNKDENDEDEPDKDMFAYRVTLEELCHLHIHNVSPTDHTKDSSDTSDLVPLFVNLQQQPFCLDSGSQADVVTTGQFDRMLPKPSLQPSTYRLWAFGATEPLKSIGCFKGSIQNTASSRPLKTTFHVVDTRGRGCNLLSKKTAQDLGLLYVRHPADVYQLSSHPLRPPPLRSKPDLPALIREYDDICHGIGCHKDTIVSLPIDPSVKPVTCPPSRVPVHLLPAIKTELDRLEAEEVVERVPVDDNTQWVSRMVPVPRKVENSNAPAIRITLDWRNINKGLGNVHHHIPSVENTKYDLNGAKMFSDLDLRDSFSQLRLDDASKKLTTFSTPWGLRRLTRLVQGAKPASAIFHETLRRDLEGLPRVKNIADNVIAWGVGNTQEDIERSHYEALESVLKLFRKKGLTLNKSKCKFGVRSISYFGYIFSEAGMSPDPEKIRALKEATPPSSKEDIRSFLGFAGYNQQFIPNYASITEPLRRLTTKEVQFKWGPEQQSAFETIREAIAETTMLSYFDPERDTFLITDASPTGVHAQLLQRDNGLLRPISFASRALTATERKYAQIEREAVAMQFGCHRFKLFLIGKPFTHIIDPESLKPMIENPRKEAPARIDRIRLKLQGYDARIKLISGHKNPADYLSRHSTIPFKSCSREEQVNAADIENHVFLVTQCLPAAITTERIRMEIVNDPMLSQVRTLVQSGRDPSTFSKSTKDAVKPYLHVWDQLSVGHGLVLRGDRLVLPSSLIKDAIDISHAGHLGIAKSKRFLRNSLWFPRMDKTVEHRVNKCLACQASTPLSASQPLHMSSLPLEPWQVLAADLFGPLPTGEKILVLKDLRSKWPEIKIFLKHQTTAADSVISAMEKIFLTHGIPDELITDNGPPFQSREFSDFAKTAGFRHKKVTPLWPQGNGQAEAFMKVLGKTIRAAITQGQDWKRTLDDLLLTYRATPHPATGASPAAVLFPGRRFKTRLPPSNTTVTAAQVDTHHEQSQAAAKLYADARRHAKITSIKLGDTVLVKQTKINKFSTPFDPHPYTVKAINGTMVTAERDDHVITRNISFFKRLQPPNIHVNSPSIKAPPNKSYVPQRSMLTPMPGPQTGNDVGDMNNADLGRNHPDGGMNNANTGRNHGDAMNDYFENADGFEREENFGNEEGEGDGGMQDTEPPPTVERPQWTKTLLSTIRPGIHNFSLPTEYRTSGRPQRDCKQPDFFQGGK